jgi:hypothetical protein
LSIARFLRFGASSIEASGGWRRASQEKIAEIYRVRR